MAPRAQGEQLLLREVVRIAFYMPHDHHDLGGWGRADALDVYLQAVGEGPETICSSSEDTAEGTGIHCDEDAWRLVRNWLRPKHHLAVSSTSSERRRNSSRRRTKKGFETCISLTGGATAPQCLFLPL